MGDKRRKTKIPFKPEAVVAWILKEATGEQLSLLNRIGSGEDLKTFINLITKFRHYQVYTVFDYRAEDDHDLALYRAARRGGVAVLEALIKAAQLASEEIERRKKVRTNAT